MLPMAWRSISTRLDPDDERATRELRHFASSNQGAIVPRTQMCGTSESGKYLVHRTAETNPDTACGKFERKQGVRGLPFMDTAIPSLTVLSRHSFLSMATKKVAESTLYHLSPKGFWKKFRQ